jgi:signal transduction histidine kinase
VRLSLRLALTFGLLAAASSVLLGVALRYRLAAKETERFQKEVVGVCQRLVSETRRQGEADQALVTGACKTGELVERVRFSIDRGDLEHQRTGFSQVVPNEREMFGVDELIVAADRDEIIGVSPMTLMGISAKEIDALLAGANNRWSLRKIPSPAILARCVVRTDSGRRVGMIAARHLDPLLARLGTTLAVTIVPSWKKNVTLPQGAGHATCSIDDGQGSSLPVDVYKSTRVLDESLKEVDLTVGIAAVVTSIVAFLAAVLLARSVSRPLSVLAAEAGKVAAGEARPLRVKGSGEVGELVASFDRMIQDLAVTRRRLAAASRVAAWREVARRVAHEVKNPLAPIRAAVETLRRLRAREDARFDEYFDEATRTVLDEVHRISNIVTEFTRFARLPSPKPQDIDVEEVARHVVQVHKPTAGEVALAHHTARRAPTIRADRDQVIQVLTNLVQNALDAVKEAERPAVTLTTDTDGHYVAFTVTDNGPGVAQEIASRMFEPYATTKASGTGLGLAIAQRIAIEHNGELSYLGPSANGKGAVFRLLLPVEGPGPMSETPGSGDVDSGPMR